MKKIICSTLVLGFCLAGSAALADEHHHGDSAPQGGEHHQGFEGGGQHGAPGGVRMSEPSRPMSEPMQRRAAPEYAPRNDARQEGRQGGGDRHQEWQGRDQRDDHGDRDREYHGAWRDFDAPRHFHEGGYRPPEGYEHRHWRHGDRLPPEYFIRDYWIGDFLAFGLFAPPPDYVWVRVGDDALLIDQYTGEVVQVEYDIFD